MGYANRGSVYAIIKKAQFQHVRQEVENHRQLELERLDSLQAALWPKAMQGHPAATEACLKLIAARCRLLGLYPDRVKGPAETSDNCQGPPTVIVREDDCRHAGCDRHGKFETLA